MDFFTGLKVSTKSPPEELFKIYVHDFIEVLLLHSDSAGIHISDQSGYSEVWFGKQQQ